MAGCIGQWKIVWNQDWALPDNIYRHARAGGNCLRILGVDEAGPRTPTPSESIADGADLARSKPAVQLLRRQEEPRPQVLGTGSLNPL